MGVVMMTLLKELEEGRIKSPRDIALLRIEYLEGRRGEGLAAVFVQMLQDSSDSWFQHLSCAKTRAAATTPAVQPIQEEKKEESDSSAVHDNNDKSPLAVAGAWPTEILARVLRLHVTLSRLDPTLGEELGRQGSHAILSRILKYDDCWEEEQDRDAIMECQEYACEVAMMTDGSFPSRTCPFAVDDLRSRLPLSFHIQPLDVETNHNHHQEEEEEEAESQLVLIRQVTARQSAQADVGFGELNTQHLYLVATYHLTHTCIVLDNNSHVAIGCGSGSVASLVSRVGAPQVRVGTGCRLWIGGIGGGYVAADGGTGV